MSFKRTIISLSILSSMALTACAPGPTTGVNDFNIPGLSNDQAAAITGTIVGAAIGKKLGKGKGNEAMKVLGAVLGGYIGAQMSAQSKSRIDSTLNNTPDYKPSSWTDPATKTQYTVTPTGTFKGSLNGQKSRCRTYKMDAWIEGRLQQVNGRACQDGAGRWVAVN